MAEKLIINDEVHGNIELDGIYKELVENEEFQRLKDIMQTGTASIKYEKMQEETRFDHSIGSYYLMCKIIENIENKLSMQGIKINPEKKEIAKIAMLLHDIGHGAYSHTLENITGFSHEKRGIDIVKDKETNIHRILVQYYGEEFANKVASFLEMVYEHKEKNVRVRNNVVNLQDLLASLVSNNIDADRLDYLTRDSKRADFVVLTEVEKLIESFEFVLDIDKIIVAIPEQNKRYIDMALLERARNYKEIYYCAESVIADHVFEILLNELRKKPSEVPESVQDSIKKFLTNRKADISTKEYLTYTDKTIGEALEKIKNFTQSEKINKLCNISEMVRSYIPLNTNHSEEYIRYLLHKAIPELSRDTKSIIEETRWVKPYKSNEYENINVMTQNGIEDYGQLNQDLINLKPFTVRTIAMSPEIMRLELGISKDEFEKKYAETVQEVISTVTKPRDEFELKYIITKGNLDGEGIIEKIEKKYKIVNRAKYLSHDVYYDNPQNYRLLENKEVLRIREGVTFYGNKKTHNFKSKRITYKKYKKEDKRDYTVRRKTEQIGESTELSEYSNFLQDIGYNISELKRILHVDNLRYLYTINVNGNLIDISYNTAFYTNELYDNIFGQVGTVEIRPRDNRISDRISLIELQKFIEQELPEISTFVSNSNTYEIGVLDTYERYKKGYIISEDADEYEKSNPEGAKKIKEISDKAKQKEDFKWLSELPTIKLNIKQSQGFDYGD